MLQGVGVQPQDAGGTSEQQGWVDAELGQPVGQRRHLGGQEAEEQLAQLSPDPSAPGSRSRKAATSPSKAPMSSFGARPSTVPAGSARPSGLGKLTTFPPAWLVGLGLEGSPLAAGR